MERKVNDSKADMIPDKIFSNVSAMALTALEL